MNRFIEIFLCLCALIVAFPLFLFAAIATFLTLGQPVFFTQTRAGKGGTVFCLAKLRTMSDARDASGNLLPDDKRVSAAGKLLRRMRLDEYPQLLSIIRGDMALVGPRPLKPETIVQFGPDGQRRGSVRPGLTGWAQVSGNTALSNEEKLRLDLWYIAHRSAALDLKIIFETVGVALFGEHRNASRLDDASSWQDLDNGIENNRVSA
ncbi:sugar transferase [Stappia sp. BW2]|uniref:sugar transferase n=1 Tax=Stappia sp. BW2 TaxID=2592622 RepID=UPI0011DEF0AE|nr:sugar transferase [Stappia sp. BW2]TYC75975.1 sugar transferase [Stappia sp. BW2]